ncbi:MAG: hypothetical protein C0187_06600 [Calditerrivibrio nitroreducens]|uniref:Uncharacterized protein n=1 Tax=Calditerrivibrio nitroreducens TaxID=477976 RepID=A0A2J6WGZ2_9BACT|nr:MAG: hypothetical protein C0187_06600 [Calditerrivibrio nitroreducens]
MRIWKIVLVMMFFNTLLYADLNRLVSLNMKNADVKDVFNALSLISNTNIVVGKGVEGKISVFLDNVTLMDAVKSVTSNADLTYRVESNIVYITKLDNLGQSTITSDNVESYFFKPKYIRLDQFEGIISNFLSSTGGKMVIDNSTGTIIITDTKANLKYLKDLIAKIDQPSQQIMIEAKIVRTTKSAGKDLGIQWGVNVNDRTSKNFPYSVQVGAGADPNRNYIVNLPISDVAKAGIGAGVGITLGNFNNTFVLNAKLNALETKGEAKIVHSPKILTMNNQKAKLESGEEIRFRETKTSTTTTIQEVDIQKDEAKTVLDITPQILNDGNILLNLSVELSEFDWTKSVDNIPAKNKNKAETQVILKDGETLIIGGLKKENLFKNEASVPLLSKIPLLGALFRNKSAGEELNELLIFVTPKIMGGKQN